MAFSPPPAAAVGSPSSSITSPLANKPQLRVRQAAYKVCAAHSHIFKLRLPPSSVVCVFFRIVFIVQIRLKICMLFFFCTLSQASSGMHDLLPTSKQPLLTTVATMLLLGRLAAQA
jgi:hypothetical protein